MKRTDLRVQIQDWDPEVLVMEEHENALLGLVEQYGRPAVALYDKDQVLRNLMDDDCSYEDALDHFEFNILGAYVGDYTPAFLVTI